MEHPEPSTGKVGREEERKGGVEIRNMKGWERGGGKRRRIETRDGRRKEGRGGEGIGVDRRKEEKFRSGEVNEVKEGDSID